MIQPSSYADEAVMRWFFRRDSAFIPDSVYQVGIALMRVSEEPVLMAYGDEAPTPGAELHGTGETFPIWPHWTRAHAQASLENWLATRWHLASAAAAEAARALIAASWEVSHTG